MPKNDDKKVAKKEKVTEKKVVKKKKIEQPAPKTKKDTKGMSMKEFQEKNKLKILIAIVMILIIIFSLVIIFDKDDKEKEPSNENTNPGLVYTEERIYNEYGMKKEDAIEIIKKVYNNDDYTYVAEVTKNGKYVVTVTNEGTNETTVFLVDPSTKQHYAQ